MSLNIKDPEAHELAQLLAEATGETMTKAVTIALRERLARVRRTKRAKATLEEVRAIAKRKPTSLLNACLKWALAGYLRSPLLKPRSSRNREVATAAFGSWTP